MFVIRSGSRSSPTPSYLREYPEKDGWTWVEDVQTATVFNDAGQFAASMFNGGRNPKFESPTRFTPFEWTACEVVKGITLTGRVYAQ